MNTRFDLNDKNQLRAALINARQQTLATYAHLTPAQWKIPYLAIVNPPLWEIGHVGWFQEYWCLRQQQNAALQPSRLKDADRLLDSRTIPHADRWHLPLPDRDQIFRYLENVLEDTLIDLDKSLPADRYFFKLTLLHEDMHTEAMLMTLQTLGYPEPAWPSTTLPAPKLHTAVNDVRLTGGAFQLGSQPGQDFVFDNEKWAHPITLSPFSISATTVTNKAFAEFVDAGGYRAREFWSDVGWQWRETHPIEAPCYWRKERRNWLARRFDQWLSLPEQEPVMHVNYHEAEAYCRWAGRRLPSEAEWEYAARAGREDGDNRYPWGNTALLGQVSLDSVFTGPVPAASLAQTDSPLRQMIGNVWEWTASPFTPYPGFSPDPYKEYSEPWFHTHQVMRGGSFCTRSRLIHNRFRNFYMPERSDMFVGFRSCALP
jgi:iron(II)-dependent oxidoreductase